MTTLATDQKWPFIFRTKTPKSIDTSTILVKSALNALKIEVFKKRKIQFSGSFFENFSF